MRCETGYRKIWHFPGCFGAIDGKHIVMQCPPKSGSKFYNYKGDFSIVLLAVVDANYRFIYIDVGAYGSQSDGGVFRASPFGEAFYNDDLQLPSFSIPGLGSIPGCLIGDSAFQLHKNLMKPYPSRGLTHSRRIFNYRLSRARRCVENAFGILASRWRVFLRPLGHAPQNVEHIVKAAVVLHNFLQPTAEYAPAGFADTVDDAGEVTEGSWRTELQVNDVALRPLLVSQRVRQYTDDAKTTRERYKRYFTSNDGEVPWQWRLPGINRDEAQREVNEPL